MSDQADIIAVVAEGVAAIFAIRFAINLMLGSLAERRERQSKKATK